MTLTYDELCTIAKASAEIAVDEAIDMLKATLSAAWDKQTQNFILRLLDRIALIGGTRTVTKTDIAEIEDQMRQAFGVGLAELSRRPVVRVTTQAYDSGKRAVVADAAAGISFTQADRAALKVLEEYTMHWVTDHYESTIAPQIQAELQAYFKEGIKLSELAERLHTRLSGDIKEQTNRYWSVFADTNANKFHNLGRVSGLEDARVEYAKVVAVVDSRTSKVCRRMHGRLIPIKTITAQRDKILAAGKGTSRKRVQQAQPFITRDTEELLDNLVATEQLTGKLGLALPPYHWRCRTRIVAYVGPTTTFTPTRRMGDRRVGNQNLLRAITDAEYNAMVADQVASAADGKLGWWPETDFEQDFRSHGQAYRTPAEYAAAARATIRNHTHAVARYFEPKGRAGDRIQISYFDGQRIAVVNEEGYIVLMFAQRSAEIAWQNSQAAHGMELY